MKNTNIQKLTIASVLCAVAVVGSLFSFPYLAVNARLSSTWSTLSAPLCWVLAMASRLLSAQACCAICWGLGSLMAFPGSMLGGSAVRDRILEMESDFPHAVGGSIWHIRFRWTVRLSGGDIPGRRERREYRVLCLHHPVPDLHSGGSYPVRDSYLWLGENGRFVPIPEYAQQTDCIRRKNCAAGNA